jgi:hypothetical protein
VPVDRGRLRQRCVAAVRDAASLPESPDAAPPNFTRPVTYLMHGLWLFVVVVGALTAAACTGDAFDRDAAIQQVVDEGGGAVSLEQATCYVDRVRDELGTASLRSGASSTPEQTARLTTIRVDCIGASTLGDEEIATVTTSRSTGGLAGPKRRGDDADLDALWDQCAAGYGQACDDLFDQSQLGSDYEAFGVTCGFRTSEERCAAVYPSPGVTLPSPAQASTTVPPPSP